MADARFHFNLGQKSPYDAGRPCEDWAHAAARGVISDLKDRRGIKNGFNDVDDDIKSEIVDSMAEIIRIAYEKGGR